MRRIEDIENVLLPNLRGEFVFAVLGSSGYGRAVLARTEHGFSRTVRHLIGGEGREYGSAIVEPQRIRVVSYSSAMRRALATEHAVVEGEEFESTVRRNVGRYYDAFAALPRGFSRTPDDEAMFVGYEVGEEPVYAEWTGEGTMRDRFGSAVAVEFFASRGSASTAEPATGDVSIAWIGGDEAPEVELFSDAARGIMFYEPAFAYESIEALPDALRFVREQRMAEREIRKAESEARERDRKAAREKFLEGERAVLRLIFGDPAGAA